MASLYTKSGKIYLSIYHNGQRITKATGLEDTKKNRKLVNNDLLPNMIFKIQTGQIDINPQEVKTVAYYSKVFMEMKKDSIKQSTVRRYHSVLNNHILPVFGDSAIDEIKVSELRRYFKQLQNIVSGKTIDLVMIVFNGIFQEAIYDEEITKNPFIHIRRIRVHSRSANPFSKEEVKIILDNADGWLKNFLGVAFFTGMRTGEILGLKWSDINWDEKEISIQRSRGDGGIETSTKTVKSTRIIPIFDEVAPFLKTQYELTGKEKTYLFLNKYGEPFKDSHRIRDYHWKRLLKKCDIEYRRLYDTRSTFATMMVSSNKFSMNLIAQILGHVDVSMLFRHYNKFIKSDVQKMDRSLNII